MECGWYEDGSVSGVRMECGWCEDGSVGGVRMGVWVV